VRSRRFARVSTLIAAVALLPCCGARTGLQGVRADGGAAPEDASVDAPFVEAAACMTAPAGTIGTFSTSVISIGLAVTGGTVYAGTAAVSQAGPLYVGAVYDVAAKGGPTLPLSAPEFNFGNLATDGARLYYPQTTGMPDGPNGAIYRVLGVGAIDLATSAVHPIANATPPWSTSSNLNSYMIAATTARPGVYWIGGSGGPAATALSAWDPQSDAVTVLASGQALSGVAVDATGVYWADVGGGQGITVYSLPLAGGTPTTLVNVPGGTHGVLLGVSSADVVFVSDYMTGAIETVSKTGGTARPLVRAKASWVNAFAWVDDPYLYWTESVTPSTLSRIPVAGGPVEVVPTQGQLQSLAFDACNVYVGTLGPTQVVVQPK
jgi:hypothetical protein